MGFVFFMASSRDSLVPVHRARAIQKVAYRVMRWRAKVAGSVCQQPTHRKAYTVNSSWLVKLHNTPRIPASTLYVRTRVLSSRSSCKTLMVCNEGLPSFFCAGFPKSDGFSKFSFFPKLNPPLSTIHRGAINNVGCCCNWIKTAGGAQCSPILSCKRINRSEGMGWHLFCEIGDSCR